MHRHIRYIRSTHTRQRDSIFHCSIHITTRLRLSFIFTIEQPVFLFFWIQSKLPYRHYTMNHHHHHDPEPQSQPPSRSVIYPLPVSLATLAACSLTGEKETRSSLSYTPKTKNSTPRRRYNYLFNARRNYLREYFTRIYTMSECIRIIQLYHGHVIHMYRIIIYPDTMLAAFDGMIWLKILCIEWYIRQESSSSILPRDRNNVTLLIWNFDNE